MRPFASSRAIAALLAAALAVAALLAWEAADAASSHRRAAEGSLRDYSRFAAGEFLRRARYEIDHFGLYPIVYVLSAAQRSSPGEALPGREEMSRLARRMQHGPLPAASLFRVDLASGVVTSSAEAPEPLAAWARERLPALLSARAPAEGELAAEPVDAGGARRLIVYGVSPDSARIGLAFEVDTKDMAPFLERAFAEAPLLPSAASGGDTPVFLQLADTWGRVLFQKGGSFDPKLGYEARVDDPGAGVFRGMTFKASVPASAAGTLLLGGLPRSRVPIVVSALALAAGLLAAAIALARRERALAAMRVEFVSAVSHELRTPLAQIRLFAETLLLDRTRSEEERRRSLAILDQEARRLSNLVDNTLQFSRAEKGTISLDLAEHDLSRIVLDAVEAFSPLASARGVRVEPSVPASLSARVDAGAMRQILLNLLDNAVKYGPPGEAVVVGLERAAGAIRIFVEDRGPGIPAADRERIWKKFVRLEGQAHSGGAGIGLAVVRDLASLHGGTAFVEDARPNGARFVVEIPSAQPSPGLHEAAAEGQA